LLTNKLVVWKAAEVEGHAGVPPPPLGVPLGVIAPLVMSKTTDRKAFSQPAGEE